MVRPEKAQEVKEITGRFNESSAALLTEYRGLSVSEIAEVRNALRESGTEYKVLKNTLARIAVREVGLEELVEMLTGPTAIAFIQGDAVEAAKALDDAAKKFPVLVIKGGVLDGKIVDADQAKALAKLEPREVQLAKIVMMVNTPLQQTANVLSALLRDFGSMLAQVLTQKEQDAPAPESQEAESGADPEASTTEDAAGAGPDAGGLAEEPAASSDADDSGAPAAEEGTPTDAPQAPEAEEQAAAAPEAEAAQPEATEEEVTEESADSEESKEE